MHRAPHTVHPSRRGRTTAIIIGLIVVLGIAGGTALVMSSTADGADSGASDRYVVSRKTFDITLPASGELAALRQVTVVNRLESRAVIKEIVDEGTYVQKGDILFTLASKDIEDRIKDAVDDVSTARADHAEAIANLEIARKAQKSDLDRAQLNIEIAQLALEAWRSGEDVSRRKELSLAMETAQINYDRLKDRLVESKRLVEKEFISMDEYKKDEIAKIEAEARLEQAKLDREVYEKYEYEQQKKIKQSDVEQAIAEKDRIEQKYASEIASMEVEVKSRLHRLNSRIERQADFEQQLELCTVRAPSEGLVVYSTSVDQGHWRGNDKTPPHAGMELRPNEEVLILPDTSEMLAEVKVNEAVSGMVEEGQTATVQSDAAPGEILRGRVMGIGVLAESGGWRDPNRRDYKVRVLLDLTEAQKAIGLKPSMRCKADINVGQVKDVVAVPVPAIVNRGPLTFVHVEQDDGTFAERQVRTGRMSELYVEVLEGLEEGETVLLRRPKAEEVSDRISEEEEAAAIKAHEEKMQKMKSMGGGPPKGMRPRGGDGGERGERRPDAEGDSASSDAARKDVKYQRQRM